MGRRSGPAILALAAAATIVGHVDASALSDKIYTTLTPIGVSKLLDLNGWIGASSLERGSIGYLYRIDTASKIDDFANANGPFFNGEGYIVLVSQSVVANKTAMSQLVQFNQLRGVLIYDDGQRLPYSAGNVRPGNGTRAQDQTSPAWNQLGGGYGRDGQLGLQWTSIIQGPVFLLNDADAAHVNARYDASRNLNSPGKVQPNMLGARLEFFMWAAGNAKMCLRRIAGGDVGSPFCQPLGGWSAAGSLIPSDHSKEAIVVAAPMDAVALFHDESWGGNAGATALAALVATARMVAYGLSDAERQAATKQVYFIAFQGEVFDFIGSTAFYTSLMGSNFPSSSTSIDPANIKQWIEFGQLGNGAEKFAHNLNPSDSTQTAAIVAQSDSNLTQASAAAATYDTPPSSFRKLASLPDRNSVTNPFRSGVQGTLITDTNDTSFTNQFFQTRLDNATNLGLTNETTSSDENIVALCNMIHAVATQISTDAGLTAPAARANQPDNTMLGDCQELVLNVLQGLLLNSSQPAASHNSSGVEYQSGIAGDGTPINRYVSVFLGSVQTAAEAFMYLQLSAALSLPGVGSGDGCRSTEAITSYHTVKTSIVGAAQYCFNTSTFFFQALSPAFSESGITYSITDDSGHYSTWTESTWDEPALSIFLMQDATEAHALVGGGTVYLVVVFVGVYFFNKKIAVGNEPSPTTLSPTV